MELFEDIRDLALELKIGLRNPNWLTMRMGYRFEYLRPTTIIEREDLPEVDLLRSKGIATNFNLTAKQRATIWDYALKTPCYGNRKLGKAFQFCYGDTHQFATAHYFNTQQDCSTIDELSKDRQILAIARGFFGREPILLGTSLWWSFANRDIALNSSSRRRYGQLFHYDLDSAATLKFFFYITDVDLGSGPHVIVQNSARRKPLIFQLKRRGWTDNTLRKYYQAEDFLTLTGSAGFGFIEDPFCFHRGTPPITKDRLMFSLNYGVADYNQQHDRRMF